MNARDHRPLVLDEHGLPRQLEVGLPGWRTFAGRIGVFLDGEDVTARCTAFDADKGTIARQRLDEAGHIFIDPATDRVAIDVLTGTVRVQWK